jgi:hypothetical protein
MNLYNTVIHNNMYNCTIRTIRSKYGGVDTTVTTKNGGEQQINIKLRTDILNCQINKTGLPYFLWL